MRKKKQTVTSILLVFFILSLFSLHSLNTGQAEDEAIIIEKDIVFGMGGDVELKLDLAHPAKRKGRFPTLVFIHGLGNVRQGYSTEIKEAAERGYVAVSIDYRQFQGAKDNYPFPAQVHDGKCAVRWLRANARKYKIDSSRIGVVGWSAGGYLSLMLGLTQPSDGLEGECGSLKYSSRVHAVISMSGYADLISGHFETDIVIIKWLGGTLEELPEQYKRASPITYVSMDDPPVLSIHGEAEPWEAEQAEILDTKFKEVGASHALIIKKGKGHGYPVDNDVWDFFDKHLKVD